MLPGCNVAELCGLRNKDEYLYMILKILRRDTPEARRIRNAVIRTFDIDPRELSVRNK